jgi:hypothetical protein
MSDYRAPVEDMAFVLQHVVNVDQLQSHQAFNHVEATEIAGILEEAGRFFSEVVAPTNRTGDIKAAGATTTDRLQRLTALSRPIKNSSRPDGAPSLSILNMAVGASRSPSA